MSVGGQTAIGDVAAQDATTSTRAAAICSARATSIPFNAQTGLRPDPQFARIRQFESTANSWYHALLTSATKRFADRYQVQAAYTLGRAENDADNAAVAAQRRIPPRGRQGRRHQQSHPHPGGERTCRSLAARLSVSGIYRYLSGDRYSPITLVDANRNLVNDRLAGYDRNTFTGPSFKTLDLRLTGRLPFGTPRAAPDRRPDQHVQLGELQRAQQRRAGDDARRRPSARRRAALEGRQLQLGVRVNF